MPFISPHPIKELIGRVAQVVYEVPILHQHAVMIGDCEAVRGIVTKRRSVFFVSPTREAESLIGVASQLDSSDEMVGVIDICTDHLLRETTQRRDRRNRDSRNDIVGAAQLG